MRRLRLPVSAYSYTAIRAMMVRKGRMKDSIESAPWPDMFALLAAIRICLHPLSRGSDGIAEFFEIQVREGDIQQEEDPCHGQPTIDLHPPPGWDRGQCSSSP